MAIVEGPLYGDSAYGKVRKTVGFYKRAGNAEATDPGELVFYHLGACLSFRQGGGDAREAQKQLFRDGVAAWRLLSADTKAEYRALAGPLQTGFNVFMEGAMSVECPPCFYDGVIGVFGQELEMPFLATVPVRDWLMHFNSALDGEIYLGPYEASVVFANITPP